MIRDGHCTHNYLLRIAAAIPEEGLLFVDIEKLDDLMKRPQQSRGWLSHLRTYLRFCVKHKLLRFDGARYYRPNRIYAMPLPPLKLPGDKIDPLWPEQARKLGLL